MTRKRILIGIGLAGAGALATSSCRGLASTSQRLATRMLERMPDDFPPRRMIRGIEATRENTERILALLASSEIKAQAPRVNGPTEARLATASKDG